jgi:hypothetical protein
MISETFFIVITGSTLTNLTQSHIGIAFMTNKQTLLAYMVIKTNCGHFNLSAL